MCVEVIVCYISVVFSETQCRRARTTYTEIEFVPSLIIASICPYVCCV